MVRELFFLGTPRSLESKDTTERKEVLVFDLFRLISVKYSGYENVQ
jgi:hypothetical protein